MQAYSVIINNIDYCCDRYMPSGYSRKHNTQELFEQVSKIPDIKGVELVVGSLFNRENVGVVKELLKKYRLEAVSVIPDHSGRQIWGRGTFTAPDSNIRKAAIGETLMTIELAREVGCNLVSIWNGQDGYDYPFQADYARTHEYLADGIRKCADSAPDMRIAIEYKAKEPRNHSFISNVHSTLLLLMEIDRDNVGLTIDSGHSLLAYENMAEAAVTAMKYKKLFHMHFNDNYRLWDDDMIAGSIHTVEFIELFYWLKKCDYDGWISLDQYPYREDGANAAEQSIQWLQALRNAAYSIQEETAETILTKQDAVAANALMRQLIFGDRKV